MEIWFIYRPDRGHYFNKVSSGWGAYPVRPFTDSKTTVAQMNRRIESLRKNMKIKAVAVAFVPKEPLPTA